MKTTEYQITAAEGLHARPVTQLIKLARSYKSVASLKKGDKVVKMNSVLNILGLALKGGDTVTVIVEGEDETEAAAAIDSFFTNELKHL